MSASPRQPTPTPGQATGHAPGQDTVTRVSRELELTVAQVSAVLALLDGGATVPFIARYRKEASGGLDEVAIRAIAERRSYLEELDKRRETILATIREQGQLSDALAAKLAAATSKQALEDLYLPYKRKRKTRASVARDKGLGPLAERILAQPASGDPEAEAAAFVDAEAELPDVATVLAEAREIVIEQIVEHPQVRARVRRDYGEQGVLETREVPGVAEEQRRNFSDWLDWSEPVTAIPSHRSLALRRGEQQGVLRSKVSIDAERLQPELERLVGLEARSPFAAELRTAVARALTGRLAVGVETDVRVELKQRADREAIEVFADNLANLLLAAPLGAVPVVGIDPGLRTGCKCAAVDATGKFLATTTIYPVRDEARAERELLAFLRHHAPACVAVGNGTGGRETEALARRVARGLAEASGGEPPLVVSVSEAGASVYSASEVAREEFPELDLTIRGAISIARRLQDPLAELVKIDPKSIGVGQYQHDVQQTLLKRKLHEVVESCVNRVGVELNTASAPLLAYVAGVGDRLARKIVAHRDRAGAFASRAALLEVAGLGPKTYEQAAGFLRVRHSDEPLDRSAVHPERYELVARMAADLGVERARLVGNAELVAAIELARYLGDGVGEPTLRDIVGELGKPGRDPRAEFEAPRFRDDVQTLEDLEVGMQLEGVVTNVTNFGAFVDLGVHQDGLVHISQLSERWVDDPRQVVKVGDRLRVRVLEVDLERRRIALTARRDGEARSRGADQSAAAGRGDSRDRGQRAPKQGRRRQGRARGGEADKRGGDDFGHNPFADKLRRR